MGLSLKGCQIVAGGRSVAKTTGDQRAALLHPGGVPRFSGTVFQVRINFVFYPVVFATLRPPATI